jgi:hypothetical protein
MKNIISKVSPYVSLASLATIIIFAILVFGGKHSKEIYILWTNIATVVYFVFSPFWLTASKRGKA